MKTSTDSAPSSLMIVMSPLGRQRFVPLSKYVDHRRAHSDDRGVWQQQLLWRVLRTGTSQVGRVRKSPRSPADVDERDDYGEQLGITTAA